MSRLAVVDCGVRLEFSFADLMRTLEHAPRLTTPTDAVYLAETSSGA